MAFRTDLAVEAIENHKSAAALPHVRQSDRTLEASPYTRYAFSQRMPPARSASRRDAISRLSWMHSSAVRRTHFRVPARRSAHCCVNCCRVRMTVRCSSPDWATV